MFAETFKLILLNKDNQTTEQHIYGSSEQNGTNIIVHPDTFIYEDDTIENIKYKLVKNMEDKNSDNYYFFYISGKKENVYQKFRRISGNKTQISNRKMNIFWRNETLQDMVAGSTEEPVDYNMNDFYAVLGRNKVESYVMLRALDVDHKENSAIINPLLNKFNYIHETNTTNSDLLFEKGSIDNNTLFGVHIDTYKMYVSENEEFINLMDTLKVYCQSIC